MGSSTYEFDVYEYYSLSIRKADLKHALSSLRDVHTTLELLHSDMSNPMSKHSLVGAWYFITFVDNGVGDGRQLKTTCNEQLDVD